MVIKRANFEYCYNSVATYNVNVLINILNLSVPILNKQISYHIAHMSARFRNTLGIYRT